MKQIYGVGGSAGTILKAKGPGRPLKPINSLESQMRKGIRTKAEQAFKEFQSLGKDTEKTLSHLSNDCISGPNFT